MVDKDELETVEVDSTYPTKGTQNFDKRTEVVEEPSQEGGASTPNKVSKRHHLRATIAANAKRSAEKEEVSRPRQVHNSQITP